MNLELAIEIINEMILKEHKNGDHIRKAKYTKEELLIFCKKLLLTIKSV